MRADSQVLFSTHTPNLARKLPYNFLRFVSIEDNEKNYKPAIYHGKKAETMNMIVDSLGVLPDHGVKVFFGVEGKNDIEYLKKISKILHVENSDIPDLEKAENLGHLIFIPIGGCGNLDLWASRLNRLGIKEFYLIDGDNSKEGEHNKQSDIDELRKANNTDTVWITSKKELENYIHKDVIIEECPSYQGQNNSSEDVPKLFAEAKNISKQNAKKKLNGEIAEKMTPELLSEIDNEDEVRKWLREIGKALKA